MDELVLALILLLSVFLLASFIFFYPKFKNWQKKKKAKADKKSDKGDQAAAAAEKPQKIEKVKRPVILAAKRPEVSQEGDKTTEPLRQQIRPNFENDPEKKIDLTSVHDRLAERGPVGSTGAPSVRSFNHTTPQIVNQQSRNDSRTKYNRTILSAPDTFEGISMDDVNYENGEVKIAKPFAADEDYMRERRLREDDNLYNELKTLSPEMKKILLADIINKKK